MNNEQYSYGGGTIGKQQLTQIAEANNMSFQELLDNNPDVKKEEGVSQQELSEARFNINNKEYDMNDIFQLAQMEDTKYKEENEALLKRVSELQESLDKRTEDATKLLGVVEQLKTTLDEVLASNARLIYSNKFFRR